MVVAIEWECRVSRWLNLMAGIGNSIYMRHPAPVEDNTKKKNNNQSIYSHFNKDPDPPTGWVLGGYPRAWAGFGEL
jgi:hypothetical protein